MKKWAYYNEKDPSAAQWIRELIKEKVVAPGEVDERSIEDVIPADIVSFAQCHWFAGVGVWSYALRQAGWPDDRRVWTGSCPCQPFSAAGKGDGFADERHLWPAWFHLIEQCRPRVIFGEQVSSKDTLPWIDLVHADLEGALYTVAAADLCSPSVGAPHIRQRLYFVAESDEGRRSSVAVERSRSGRQRSISDEERSGSRTSIVRRGTAFDLAFTDGGNSGTERQQRSGKHGQQPQDGGIGQLADALPAGRTEFDGHFDHGLTNAGPTNGFWRDAEWIYCRDGKWRPVGTIESGAFEMADELAADLGCVRDQSSGRYTISPLIEKGKARVSRLRGYGNAIVAEVAIAWIASYLEEQEAKHETTR